MLNNKSTSEFHEVCVLICPGCSYLEYPGCGIHNSLLTLKKGNGHMQCRACGIEYENTDNNEQVQNQLLALNQIAATDMSAPWNEYCRNCDQIRANPYAYLLHDEISILCADALTRTQYDIISTFILVCNECRSYVIQLLKIQLKYYIIKMV